MKPTFIPSILVTSLLMVQAAALKAQEFQSQTTDKKFGVGLMLGEPTGANCKFWLSDVSAIDAAMGISFADEDNFTAHAGYLHHFNNLIHLNRDRMSVYFGGGPRFKVRDHRSDLFGIRVVGGAAYIFDELPLDIFCEAGPVFDLTPDAKVRYTVSAGVRFWF